MFTKIYVQSRLWGLYSHAKADLLASNKNEDNTTEQNEESYDLFNISKILANEILVRVKFFY